jgi:hypothetical protein
VIDHDTFHDVTRTVYEFAYGIDTRDWALYRSIFAPEVEFDYESYNGRPATRLTPDAWIGGVTRLFMGLDATQHTMSNPLVDVDAAGARCRMYMQAAHFLTDDAGHDNEFTIGGYYDDHLVYGDVDGVTRWRLDAVKLTVWWRRGDDDIMRVAHERSARRAG